MSKAQATSTLEQKVEYAMASAGFFQPGPSQADTTTSTTLSPAQQALQKFRLEMLGRLLNNAAGNGPTFKSFVQGGPASRPVPGGLGDGSAAVLQAMGQPGAFTTTSTGSKTETGGTPSMMSDLTQLAMLGMLASKSGLLDGLTSGAGSIWDLLKGKYGDTGAVSGAMGDTAPMPTGGSTTTGNAALDALIGSQYGSGATMIPGGSADTLNVGYPGLLDGSLGNGNYGTQQALMDLFSTGLFG